MINKMGDKATAKATMIEAGVPCVPSYFLNFLFNFINLDHNKNQSLDKQKRKART